MISNILTLRFIPVNLTDVSILENVKDFIMSRLNVVVKFSKEITLGELLKFYDERRDQLDAVKLLLYLEKKILVNPLLRVLVFIDSDAYAYDLNFIFGIAKPYWGGIVFLRRLDPSFYGYAYNEKLFTARLIKESVHELGHSLGLAHCRNRRCVMSFSNNIFEVDNKSPNFCRNCEIILERMHPGLIRILA